MILILYLYISYEGIFYMIDYHMIITVTKVITNDHKIHKSKPDGASVQILHHVVFYLVFVFM